MLGEGSIEERPLVNNQRRKGHQQCLFRRGHVFAPEQNFALDPQQLGEEQIVTVLAPHRTIQSLVHEPEMVRGALPSTAPSTAAPQTATPGYTESFVPAN